jgi:predicted peptidase
MKAHQSILAVLGLSLAFGLTLPLALAQPAPQNAARSWSNDSRVQSRTYVFTNTSETLPYAVFVSSKVTKDRKAPLIVALRGAGGNPGVFMHEPALTLAEEGGYIMVAPMGYTAMGNFGNPATSMGGFGRRGGAGTNAPGRMTRPPGTNSTARAAQPGGADASKTSEYSELDVMNVLAIVRKEFNIDDHRIYLMGHSQGGAGALHIADKYYSIWAAVAGLAPGAPGFQLDADAKFKDVPVLIMVGANDTLISSVQRLDERMKTLNIAHEYQEVPGKDHGGIIMGAMPEVFKFFGQHTKP